MNLPLHALRNVTLRILILVFLMLGSFATVASALDVASYMQFNSGNQWSFQNSNSATSTVSVGSSVALPGSVAAIPVTTIRSDQPGYSVLYYTIDGDGLRRHQEYTSSVFVNGYGNTSVTLTYSPAIVLSPASVTAGSTYTSAGTATLDYTNMGRIRLVKLLESNSRTAPTHGGTDPVSAPNRHPWLRIAKGVDLTNSGCAG